MFHRAVAIVLLFSLSACAVLQQVVQAPDVSVTDMRLAKAGLFEQVLEFDLELGNPNGFSLPLAAMEYTLVVSGVEIGRGAQTQALTLPAYGQARWPVNFKVNSLKLLQGVLSEGAFQGRDYRIFGSFRLSESSRLPAIPFEQSGQIGSAKP